jgi:hypothetical protein
MMEALLTREHTCTEERRAHTCSLEPRDQLGKGGDSCERKNHGPGGSQKIMACVIPRTSLDEFELASHMFRLSNHEFATRCTKMQPLRKVMYLVCNWLILKFLPFISLSSIMGFLLYSFEPN